MEIQVKWLSNDSFQVSEDTPVRRLRALEGEGNVEAVWLTFLAFEKTCEDFLKHKGAQREEAEAADDLAAHFILDELSLSYAELIDVITGNLKVCLRTRCFPYVAMQAISKLSPSRAEALEFGLIKLVIPDFDKEKEYDSLTAGETKDIIDGIKYIANRRLN